MPSAEEFLRPAPSDTSTNPVYKRLMVATDGDEVRSGILLHHHVMCVRGAPEQFCWCIMPVSEGLVNRNHSMSILRLIKSTQAYKPFLLSLGVGSTKEAWAQLLISLGWKTEPVPFFFLPLHTTKMLGLPLLQKRRSLKWVLSAVAYSGAGALGRTDSCLFGVEFNCGLPARKQRSYRNSANGLTQFSKRQRPVIGLPPCEMQRV